MEGLSLSALLGFNAALLAAWASPGPAFLVALRASVSGGARAGIATGAGLALVAAGWTLAALVGLEALFAGLPALFLAAKILGALYLLSLAWQTWRGARAPLPQIAPPAGRAFRQGVAVNLANPKSVLFAAAVLVVLFPAEMAPVARLTVALNHFLLELALYTALATVLSRAGIRAAYLRAKPALDRGAAVVLGALGLRLIWSPP